MNDFLFGDGTSDADALQGIQTIIKDTNNSGTVGGFVKCH